MSTCYPTGCTPCDEEISFPKNPSDSYYSPKGDIDLTQTVAEQNITLSNNDVYTVTVASASQAFLTANYPGLTHTVKPAPAPNQTRIKYNASENTWRQVFATRYCVPIGSLGETKCWVWDICVPGWRAEGPSTSPTRYRGLIDVATQDPADDIQAGDWYIQNKDVTSVRPTWTGLTAPVGSGDRIIWSGTKWEELSPPNVPYADEALGDVDLDADSKPTPDTRMGGIVKNATLSQAKALVDKCDTITPYTLKGALNKFKEDNLVDFNPTKPNPDGGVVVEIDGGPTLSQCITNTTLVLSATGTATATDGSTAIGRWKYQWSENDTELRQVREEAVTGGSTDSLIITDFTITPTTGTRTFKITATFTDLFGDETSAEDTITVSLANAVSITTQPTDLDLETDTTGAFAIVTTPADATLAAPALTFKWYANNVEITGDTEPDIGYTFTNFTTATLGVTRTADDAGTYSVHAEVTGGCQGMIVSDTAFLKGPGEAVIAPPPAGTDLYSIGSYSIINLARPSTVLCWTGTLTSGGTITWNAGCGAAPLPGTWRVMGQIFSGYSPLYPNNPSYDNWLVVRIK